MAYRHCRKCGWGYPREEWIESAYCINCGVSLWKQQKPRTQRGRVGHIDPYPDWEPTPATGTYACIDSCKQFAVAHPYLFGAGAVGVGVAAILAATQLMVIAQAVTVIGIVLICAGMLGVALENNEDSVKIISAGLLVFLAGLGLSLVAYILAIAGIMAAVAGGGVAAKASVEDAIRWRLRKQMEGMGVIELLGISRRMNAQPTTPAIDARSSTSINLQW